MKGFVYHDFSYLPSSDHCVKVGSDLLREIIKPSNAIGRLKMCRLSSIYHPVRCRNSDSSLIPYFHFSSVLQIISLRASTDEVYPDFKGFLLVIHSPSQISDCSTRHQTFGATSFHYQIQSFWTTFLYAIILNPSLSGEQNIKEGKKITKKHLPRKVSAHLQSFCLCPIRRSKA